jgi:ankyrin repeat protein
MAGGDWKEMLAATQNGDLDLVKYHLQMGVDPNYQHPELMTTPLIESIESGHLDIAEFLLKNGADPGIKAGFSTDTALSVARRNKNRAAIKLLKAYIQPRFRFPWVFDFFTT